jgi:bifunctional oligoribonuclease and PAP phosphatase NrnA
LPGSESIKCHLGAGGCRSASGTGSPPDGGAGGPAGLAGPDLIVVLDSGDLERLDTVYVENADLFQRLPVINVDHHPTNHLFGSVNIVESRAAAAGELLYILFRRLNMPIDETVAVCLLAAIAADTLVFTTNSTTSSTMRAAAGLMDAGASLAPIVEQLNGARPLSTVRLWGKVLSQVQTDGPLIWSWVTQKTLVEVGAKDDESDGLSSFLIRTRGAKVAILFKEVEERLVKASLRSTPDVDVAKVAWHFGGGGHRQAAGCQLRGELEQVERAVLDRAREQIKADSAS